MPLPGFLLSQKTMLKTASCLSLISAIVAIAPPSVNAQQSTSGNTTTSSLTVEIAGVKNSEGQICVSLFSGSQGFPDSEEAVVEKRCVAAIETVSPESGPETGPETGPEIEPETGQPVDLPEISESLMQTIEAGLSNSAGNSNIDSTRESNQASQPSLDNTEENTAVDSTDLLETDPIQTDSSETDSSETVVITEALLALTFTAIEPGTYAVSVLHDENEDGELNTGSFGIPAEGFGFSQNPEITLGAPDFSEAAIVVVGAATTQVELIYY